MGKAQVWGWLGRAAGLLWLWRSYLCRPLWPLLREGILRAHGCSLWVVERKCSLRSVLWQQGQPPPLLHGMMAVALLVDVTNYFCCSLFLLQVVVLAQLRALLPSWPRHTRRAVLLTGQCCLAHQQPRSQRLWAPARPLVRAALPAPTRTQSPANGGTMREQKPTSCWPLADTLLACSFRPPDG